LQIVDQVENSVVCKSYKSINSSIRLNLQEFQLK